MVVAHGESGGLDNSAGVSDGGRSAAWTEISIQNTPGGVSSPREAVAFAPGVGGTSDATIGKDFITFAGTKDGSVIAQRTDGETTNFSKEGKFGAQRTDYPDGSARASISDLYSITEVDIKPDGTLGGIDTLRSNGAPSQRESGDELKDKFVPNIGPDGKPDGTSSYTTPDGVRIDKGNCGEVISVSKDGTSVYNRAGSQCVS